MCIASLIAIFNSIDCHEIALSSCQRTRDLSLFLLHIETYQGNWHFIKNAFFISIRKSYLYCWSPFSTKRDVLMSKIVLFKRRNEKFSFYSWMITLFPTCWFQQYAATCHKSRETINYIHLSGTNILVKKLVFDKDHTNC